MCNYGAKNEASRLVAWALVLLVGGFFAPNVWAEESPSLLPCSGFDGLVEEPVISFVVDDALAADGSLIPSIQRSLISDLGHRSSWIEIEYNNTKGVRLVNRAPGLGLPFTAYHLRFEIADEEGRIVPGASVEFPSLGECKALALFPGQKSASIPIPHPPRAEQPQTYRLRVTLWSSKI